MMTALLLYAYTQGIYSSLRIARGCQTRVDFMAVTAMQQPDHRTVSDFCKRHLAALADLFGQVLKLCQRAGSLGHFALDRTKVQANASKRKAISYARERRRRSRGWGVRPGAARRRAARLGEGQGEAARGHPR
jgi:transposase